VPLKCFERPNRTRVRTWTKEHVGQVYCIVRRQGVTKLELEKEFAKCDVPEGEKRSSEALEAMQVGIVAIEESTVILDADAAYLQRFLSLMTFAALLLRIIQKIPRVGPVVSVGLVALRELAAVRLGRITVQKAANDEALIILRRAAANEARFIRTGT